MVGTIPTTCPRTLSIPAVANSLWAAHFALTDRLHRAQGDALEGGARPARMPVPSDLFGAALAFTRIWRARPTTIAAHGACTNQTTVHLRPHSFRKRRALLLASGFPCPSARMDAAKPRWIGRPGRIRWPGYRRVRSDHFEPNERSTAIPHRALAGWYARDNSLCLGAPIG